MRVQETKKRVRKQFGEKERKKIKNLEILLNIPCTMKTKKIKIKQEEKPRGHQ